MNKVSRIMNSFGITKIPCYRAVRRLSRAAYGKTARADVVAVRRSLLRDLNLRQIDGIWRKL